MFTDMARAQVGSGEEKVNELYDRYLNRRASRVQTLSIFVLNVKMTFDSQKRACSPVAVTGFTIMLKVERRCGCCLRHAEAEAAKSDLLRKERTSAKSLIFLFLKIERRDKNGEGGIAIRHNKV